MVILYGRWTHMRTIVLTAGFIIVIATARFTRTSGYVDAASWT